MPENRNKIIPCVATVSGKGGVGKSLAASTIVKELLSNGKRVGAIDADLSNPNLGRLLQVQGDISITADKKLVPVSSDGVSFFSIDKVVQDKGVGMSAKEYAIIIRDVVENGIWNVDYMVVDLPAVIGDEFRAVLSIFEDSYLGSIVVAQPAHMATAERVLELHQLNDVPVLGVLENMVGFTCGKCSEHYDLFGASGVDVLAAKYNVPVIGKVPVLLDVQNQINAKEKVFIPDPQIRKDLARAILEAKPREMGFIAEMKQKVKQVSRDVVIKMIVTSVQVINANVDIGELQQRYNFPGGVVFGVAIMDEKMENYVERFNFIIEDGKMIVLKNPDKVDVMIYVKGIALAWSIIGKKKFPNGKEIQYSIVDAWRNGDAVVQGAGAIVRAIAFYRDIWEMSRSSLAPKLEPIISKLV